MDVSRRDLIKLGSTAAAGSLLIAQAAQAQTPMSGTQMALPTPVGFKPADPALKFDLVIANGDVLDPSQRLRGKRDIGIKNGQMAAIGASIAADRAVQHIDAGGRLVTPGLVDVHTHLIPHIGIGLPADELVGITGTTTAVSAGDTGARTLGAFTHWARPQTRTRLFAFVHISTIGLAGSGNVGEMLNINYANVDACAQAVAENPDVVLGVRCGSPILGQNGLEPLRRAILAATVAGPQFRVMCHIGAAPGSISDLLDLLRPGDLLTHAFSGAGNNIVQNGQLLPAAKAAKQRGVIFDVGHGGGSFSINTPGYPVLPNLMSKFLNLGVSLEEVVARTTWEPAKIIGRVPGLGTLLVGAPADMSIFELVDGPVEFVDTRNNKRSGTKKLVPWLTVKGGRPWGRPPLPIPFS